MRSPARIFLGLSAFLAAAGVSSAATKTWTGAVNNLWSVPGNWSSGVPATGDDLLFPTSSSNHVTINDLALGTVFGSLTLLGGGSGGTFKVGGNLFGVTGGITASPGVIDAAVKLVGSQTFSGGIQLNGPIDLNGNTLTLTGSEDIEGDIVGAGSVSASANLTLGGSSAFPGTITLNSGQLYVPGSWPNAAINMSSGGFLGVGPIGNFAATGQIGMSPGTTGFLFGILRTGNFSLSPNSGLTIDIGGPTVGTQYDQVKVTGTTNISGVVLLGHVNGPVTVGEIFKIIDNDGADAIVGAFAGLPEGATFSPAGLPGIQFRISYIGGDGNDAELTVVAAPKIWTGAVSSLWSVAGNWSSGVPSAGDPLVFPDTASNHVMINDLTPGTVFGSVWIGGQGATVPYKIGGNSFGVTGGISANPGVIETGVKLVGSQTFSGSIQFNGPIDLNGSTLTLAAAGDDIEGGLVGPGSVVVMGATVTLGGSSNFAGPFTQSTGNVDAKGFWPNLAFNLFSGTLSGGGTLGSVTGTGQAIVFPQDLVSRTLRTGNFSLFPNSAMIFRIEGPTVGVDYNQLKVTGTVNIAGTVLNSAVTVPVLHGQTFTIIDNDGVDPIVGTFAGLPEGATFTPLGLPGIQLQITYKGGDGNDVVLTVVSGTPTGPSVPTLSSTVLALLGLLLAAVAVAVLQRVRR